MTGEKILEAVEHYRLRFKSADVKKERHSGAQIMKSSEHALRHCHWMLDGIAEFTKNGELEKAQRWLCFVQGVLWQNLYYTIDDMREHNR